MGEPKPMEPPRFLTIPAAAARYGFKNALACKRFCLRHAVPLKCVGKLRFVAPADLEALIAGERELPANELGAEATAGADLARVESAAAKLMGGGRR